MELPLPALPSFKYQHADTGTISRGRKIAAGVLAALALLGFFVLFPAGIFLLIVALVVFFYREKKLLIGPRYLVCGNTLVYYANVTRLDYSETEGQLRLQTAKGKTFLLERDKFPTNARKTDKIKRNKAAKFVKVSGKIIDKVRAAAPAAQLVGVQ